MYIESAKQTAKLILALVLGAAILAFGLWINNLQNKAALADQRGKVIEATVGVTEDGAKDDAQRAKVETGVTTGREEFKATTEKAKRDEPATAARADRPVPASVRNAYRARRLARERSAGIESERTKEPEAAPAPKR